MRADMAVVVTAAVIFGLTCHMVNAQVYDFKDVPLPMNKSLHVLQLFYIFEHAQIPAVGRTTMPAFVKFQNFESHSTLPTVSDTALSTYEGVQVTVMPFPQDFKTVINPNQFCSTSEDVLARAANKTNQLVVLEKSRPETHSHTVHFKSQAVAAAEQQAELKNGGVYMLVLSNCGDYANATLSGSVLVRNEHGFLPGDEYYKMPFFGWLAILYGILLIVWLGALLVKWKELIFLHYYVLVMIFVGLVETLIWWIHLNNWNNSGVKMRALSCSAVVSSVVKVAFSYMFCLAVALGWGVTQQSLSRCTNKKMEALTFFYVIACYVRETVLSFRHSHNLPASYLIGSLVPTALLNVMIFIWIFSALSSLMAALEERHQEDTKTLFERTRNIMVLAVVIVYSAFFFQIFEIMKIFEVHWRYQWVLNDAVPHIVFLLVLIVMMFLWKPSMELHMYSYSPQVPQDDGEEEGKVFSAPEQGVLPDDDDDEEKGDRTKVSPEIIGMTADVDFRAAE